MKLQCYQSNEEDDDDEEHAHGYSRGCIITSFIGKESELLYASFGNILLKMHSSLMMTMEKVGRGIRLLVENIYFKDPGFPFENLRIVQ